MRLKLTLQTNETKIIPINYQYFLSSAIYNYLKTADIDFSTILHNGTHTNSGKKFKYFTFSWLQIPDKQIINSQIKIFSPEIFWYISSPWDKFIQNLVTGLLELGQIKIENISFLIKQIETLSEPNNSINNTISNQKFTCLSPIVITTKKDYKGTLSKYYYRISDSPEEISEKIRQNLINKYNSFYGNEPKESSLKITFDANYIKTTKGQVLSHYLKYDENKNQNLNIKIPAILCPFTAEGSKDLINFGTIVVLKRTNDLFHVKEASFFQLNQYGI